MGYSKYWVWFQLAEGKYTYSFLSIKGQNDEKEQDQKSRKPKDQVQKKTFQGQKVLKGTAKLL